MCGDPSHWSKECPKRKGTMSAATEDENQQGNGNDWGDDWNQWNRDGWPYDDGSWDVSDWHSEWIDSLDDWSGDWPWYDDDWSYWLVDWFWNTQLGSRTVQNFLVLTGRNAKMMQ